jgi:hypothetical protein
MATSETSWFIGLFGPRRSTHSITVPLRYIGLGVEAVWPMSGKPRALYLDNGAEFHSEALPSPPPAGSENCSHHRVAPCRNVLG